MPEFNKERLEEIERAKVAEAAEKTRCEETIPYALRFVIICLNTKQAKDEEEALQAAAKNYNIPVEMLRKKRAEQTGNSAVEIAREKRLRALARVQSVI